LRMGSRISGGAISRARWLPRFTRESLSTPNAIDIDFHFHRSSTR
jgi:hypothetical protein